MHVLGVKCSPPEQLVRVNKQLLPYTHYSMEFSYDGAMASVYLDGQLQLSMPQHVQYPQGGVLSVCCGR